MCMLTHTYEMIGEHAIENRLLVEYAWYGERWKCKANSTFILLAVKGNIQPTNCSVAFRAFLKCSTV